ncbi:MAG: NYN domain-containing protein [Acidimicrobiales bacterium]
MVDGSNLATEGRVTPSLTQLDEAVSAFSEENPSAEIIVVVDATFEHRAAPNERSRFNDAVLAGEIVTPPAGAVGRGDAFILKIADRIDGVVLSNDSFQEFQDGYPWLFDVGRLIGGKPVRGVGWVFTPRVPVRNVKVTRAAKKLAVTLPSGVKPTIGTTLTPVKTAKKSAPTKRAVAKQEKAPEKAPERSAAKSTTKSVKKVAKALEPLKKPTAKKSAVKVPATKAAKKVAKVSPPTAAPTPAPAVALRRGRHPVNPEADFTLFKTTYRVGSRVPGEVTAFTSHGAVINVQLKGGKQVECYAPTTALGTPAPARARDVLKRGDQRTFRLMNVDSDRRIAELALA